MQRLSLNGEWQLQQVGSDEVIPANVPGCVHTDLLAAGKIEEPFYRIGLIIGRLKSMPRC